MLEGLLELSLQTGELNRFHYLKLLGDDPTESELSLKLQALCGRLNQLPRDGELDPQAIKTLSSEYLAEGFKKEVTEIEEILLDAKTLSASGKIRLSSIAISATDEEGFHLSAPVVVTLLGQLVVVVGHALLGFNSKDIEVWVREYTVTHRRPLRDPNDIRFNLKVSEIRPAKSNDRILGFTYEIGFNDGAVLCTTKIFYDLTRKL